MQTEALYLSHTEELKELKSKKDPTKTFPRWQTEICLLDPGTKKPFSVRLLSEKKLEIPPLGMASPVTILLATRRGDYEDEIVVAGIVALAKVSTTR